MRYLTLSIVLTLIASTANAAAPTGVYVEARTCQVYTGPCFANGEVGLAGKEAVMAWSIREGEFEGVNLAGCSAVLVASASDTIGFQGFEKQRSVRSMLIVNQDATADQEAALTRFVKQMAGKAADTIVSVQRKEISLSLDVSKLSASLDAGTAIKLRTRKARPDDCICSNESAYYPPLSQLTNFAPGVTLEGEVSGRALGTKWSIPDSRSSYMGMF